jgi:hypothetical protein
LTNLPEAENGSFALSVYRSWALSWKDVILIRGIHCERAYTIRVATIKNRVDIEYSGSHETKWKKTLNIG